MNTYRITGTTGDWEVVIGLKVHAQVTAQSKLFSGAATAFGAEPNSQVRDVAGAQPRMHPPGGAHRAGNRTARAVFGQA